MIYWLLYQDNGNILSLVNESQEEVCRINCYMRRIGWCIDYHDIVVAVSMKYSNIIGRCIKIYILGRLLYYCCIVIVCVVVSSVLRSILQY